MPDSKYIKDTKNIKIEEFISNKISVMIPEVEGVSSLVQPPIGLNFSRRSYDKGIFFEKNTGIDFYIYINVKYNSVIPQTAFAVQETVKNIVLKFSDFKPGKINITILGVDN